jgi:hypothetical protein
MDGTGEISIPFTHIHKNLYMNQTCSIFKTTFMSADGMSSVAAGGTGAIGKQGGVPFLDNSSDDDTGNPHQYKFIY